MRKNIKVDKIREKATTNITRNIRIGFFAGLPIFVYGLLKLLFLPPSIGINLKTKLLQIDNGSVALILGLGFLLGGIYGAIKREKLIRKESRKLMQERKERTNLPKWNKHY